MMEKYINMTGHKATLLETANQQNKWLKYRLDTQPRQ